MKNVPQAVHKTFHKLLLLLSLFDLVSLIFIGLFLWCFNQVIAIFSKAQKSYYSWCPQIYLLTAVPMFSFTQLASNPKAQFQNIAKGTTDRGLSSVYQSNLFRSFHKFSHKSWSNFIFRISTNHQLQNLDQTSAFRLNLNFKTLTIVLKVWTKI